MIPTVTGNQFGSLRERQIKNAVSLLGVLANPYAHAANVQMQI